MYSVGPNSHPGQSSLGWREGKVHVSCNTFSLSLSLGSYQQCTDAVEQPWPDRIHAFCCSMHNAWNVDQQAKNKTHASVVAFLLGRWLSPHPDRHVWLTL